MCSPTPNLTKRFKEIGVELTDLNEDQWQLFWECRFRLLVCWVFIGETLDGMQYRRKVVRLLKPTE